MLYCFSRISVWVRRSTKTKRLVNTKLWQTIKAKFPAKVEARLKGEEDSDSEGMSSDKSICSNFMLIKIIFNLVDSYLSLRFGVQYGTFVQIT